MDKETKKILDEGKVLKEFISHEGYVIAKAKLFSRVSGLIDIHTIDMNVTPEHLAIELKARQKASQTILDWIRVDIEGTVQQAETNGQNFTLNQKSWIIREDATE